MYEYACMARTFMYFIMSEKFNLLGHNVFFYYLLFMDLLEIELYSWMVLS